MSTYTHPYETDGQHLAHYLLVRYLGGRDQGWEHLGEALWASNRSGDWVEAFQEMVSLQLARRLILAGDALLCDHESDASEAMIKQVILDTMQVHWDVVQGIYERLMPAVRSARSSISRLTRQAIEDEAKQVRPFCYLCGADMDFSGGNRHAFTIDHVWPRAYGGNSDFDNLLVACRACNKEKASEPSWAMYPIQSLIAGFDTQNLSETPRVLALRVNVGFWGCWVLVGSCYQ